MSDRFSTCHSVTAAWEGGWSNHKDDPGGKTMYGVTEPVFHSWLKSQDKPLKPVAKITKNQALAIYKANYWAPTAGRYKLKPGVDLAVYDAGVNSGVSRALKWMKAGIDKNDRHVETVKNICRQRLSFMQGLRHWKTFGRGWTNRVTDIEAKGVKMALAAENDALAVQLALSDESRKSKETSNRQAGVATGSGVAAGGSTQVDVDPELVIMTSDQISSLAHTGMIGVLVVFGLWLGWRAWLNHKRAMAFGREAVL